MSKRGKTALRVLAVDDSAVMRGVLRTAFRLHAEDEETLLPPMELCGVVRDGVECLEAVTQLQPDVVLLDMEMPRMNGMEVLARMRLDAPGVPVILCSAYTEQGAKTTLDALALGAKDYVTKPEAKGDFASAMDELMQQLLPKIAALAGADESGSTFKAHKHEGLGSKLRGRLTGWGSGHGLATPAFSHKQSHQAGAVRLVVIGVSTGGPSALEEMLPKLPSDFPVPVMIVQHMPKLFVAALADRLDKLCSLRVREAYAGALVKPGTIWLAPGDAHLEIADGARGLMAILHQQAMLNSCKPSVDYLFRSAAEVLGEGTLGVIMTGMGADGLEGARAIKKAGGTMLAQDERTSAVWGMPGRVDQAGLADETLPLYALAEGLMKRASRNSLQVRAGLAGFRQEVMYGSL